MPYLELFAQPSLKGLVMSQNLYEDILDLWSSLIIKAQHKCGTTASQKKLQLIHDEVNDVIYEFLVSLTL